MADAARPCPFCRPEADRIFHVSELVLGLWDGYPLAPGHALVVPKRHVARWAETTERERTALLDAVDQAIAAIEARHAPDGYNLGLNDGAAAGQTVPHLHLHVIPRTDGDVDDPRGGVRWVLPAKAAYWGPDAATGADPTRPVAPAPSTVSEATFPLITRPTAKPAAPPPPTGALRPAGAPRPTSTAGQDGAPHNRALIRGGEADALLPHLKRHLEGATGVDIAVAFITGRGLTTLADHLRELLENGGRLRIVTGDYGDVTDPDALQRLLDLREELARPPWNDGDGDHREPGPAGAAGSPVAGAATAGRPRAPGDPATDGPPLPGPGPGEAPAATRSSLQESVDRLQLHVFETAGGTSFHPKAYLFHGPDGPRAALVGSSNLTEKGLKTGLEWNFRVVDGRDPVGLRHVADAFEELLRRHEVRPLDVAWLEGYRRRRPAEKTPEGTGTEIDKPEPPPTPHAVQQEALAALERTRAEGNAAGLVVLATGLGKTWLSAFDSAAFQRVLFVAHREEILGQALRTFRRIRPRARLGRFTGTEKSADAEVLFASIQTLGKLRNLRQFDRRAFDYLVVDEFHHAAAPTYRRLIDWFDPDFLLGLTATPERTDGGDLFALCGENLVYTCDLTEGIRRGLLCPYHYFGVPDEVDYTNIPWRSSRFDEEALTRAVATQRRAQNALEQHRRHAGRRTLAFCCSTRHADFMAETFREHGLRAAAVHSGETSAPRTASLERLQAGELDVLFAVDMFSEGVDLPDVDTILMLRPTESKILWLQQFGRGLRTADGKDHLRVIDYIGNHRVFLLKPQTLFALRTGDHEIARVLKAYEDGALDLPPGCEVTYDLESVSILRGLLRTRGPDDSLLLFYEMFREQHDRRPLAVEAFLERYTPRAARKSHGSWPGFVRAQGGLTPEEEEALDSEAKWFEDLEKTPMTKSFKMVVLEALLNREAFPGSLDIETLVEEVRILARRSPHLRQDFGIDLDDRPRLRRLLEVNPIEAWVGGKGTRGTSYFAYEDGRLSSRIDVPERLAGPFRDLVREIVDWRLAEYRDRAPDPTAEAFTCKVSHASGRPILFLPDREAHPGLPSGWTPVVADGERHEANFVKVAVNVMRREGSERNELPDVLRGWFGPQAGRPGTGFHVVFERREEAYTMGPADRSQS